MNEQDLARTELPLQPQVFEILLALSAEPAHGYGIIKQVEVQSAGAVKLSTSSLYASLKRMASSGLVEDDGHHPREASGGPQRKYFRITGHGQRVARAEASRLRRAADLAKERLVGGI